MRVLDMSTGSGLTVVIAGLAGVVA